MVAIQSQDQCGDTKTLDHYCACLDIQGSALRKTGLERNLRNRSNAYTISTRRDKRFKRQQILRSDLV